MFIDKCDESIFNQLHKRKEKYINVRTITHIL